MCLFRYRWTEISELKQFLYIFIFILEIITHFQVFEEMILVFLNLNTIIVKNDNIQKKIYWLDVVAATKILPVYIFWSIFQ